MKKRIALFLLLSFVLTLTGCGKTADNGAQAIASTPNRWGITLEAENITRQGLTIVCSQSGGENVAQLLTGSYFVIQKLEDSEWVDVRQKHEVSWTAEAWLIQKKNTVRWEVSWDWLYGKLPAGQYRIGKEILNFRGTGDYDEETLYAFFVIK